MSKMLFSKRLAVVVPTGVGKARAEFVGRGMIFEPVDKDVEGAVKGYSVAYELWEFRIFEQDGTQMGLPAELLATLMVKFKDEIRHQMCTAIEGEWLKRKKKPQRESQLKKVHEKMVERQRTMYDFSEDWDKLDDDRSGEK